MGSGCAGVGGGFSSSSSRDRRADCRAKFESSAKRISDLEARKGVGGALLLLLLLLLQLDGGGGDDGEVWAVKSVVVRAAADVVVLSVHERLVS